MLSELKQENRYDSDQSQLQNDDRKILNQGVWQHQQVLKFMVFSSFNVNILTSKLQRRTTKVFKQMARFIGTRSSTQCRSQNQKLIKKYHNIKKILNTYEMQIGNQEFKKACMEHFESLKAMQLGRKKVNVVRHANFVSVQTQTQFSEDSEESKIEKIKIEQQGMVIKDFKVMRLNTNEGFSEFGNLGLRKFTQ